MKHWKKILNNSGKFVSLKCGNHVYVACVGMCLMPEAPNGLNFMINELGIKTVQGTVLNRVHVLNVCLVASIQILKPMTQ